MVGVEASELRRRAFHGGQRSGRERHREQPLPAAPRDLGLGEARRAQADVYVTSDLKYNDFMTPDGAFVVADIGHFESEYCAIDILFDILSKNLFTFAVRKSVNSRNPIGYIVPSKQ